MRKGFIFFVVGALSGLLSWAAQAGETVVEPFAGSFVVKGEIQSDGYGQGELEPIDLATKVLPLKIGFEIQRTRLIPHSDGLDRHNENLVFEPTATPSLFAGADAGEPVRRRNYYWSSVNEGVLKVRTLRLLADGRLDLTILSFSPNAEGVWFEAKLIRDNEPTRTIKAQMVRQ